MFMLLQPIAEEPFRFETELDDLPKEKLKGTMDCTHALLVLLKNNVFFFCAGKG